MGFKSQLIAPFSKFTRRVLLKDASRGIECQQRIFQSIVTKASATAFGSDHGFADINSPGDFAEKVPIRDYEGLREYFDRVASGERDILWPGRPRYLAKTSGTTSGVKYIPLTSDSIPNHINSARNALFNYQASTGNGAFFDGKMIFLSGAPTLSDKSGVPTGRLSGIVNHLIPAWVRRNQMPSFETNCIEDWEQKVDAIVAETLEADMRLISGIPPWVQMYYERLLEASGKDTVAEIFPNYSLFVYGGVNYQPYAAKLSELVGHDIDTLETYPASEGFIAYQDTWPFEGLRLNVNSGIFFEFVPLDQMGSESPDRLTLADVELDKDYAIILSSNAGLWGYNIGDTVRFTSLNPFRLIVSGRVKHFISAFGEHVIGKEVDQAMREACEKHNCSVVEFCVAPQVNPKDQGAPYHEWFVEFGTQPIDHESFRNDLERSMNEQNIYYRDLTDGNILRPLELTILPRDAFRKFMESRGKLGGQNKVPRLQNDRNIADLLSHEHGMK